MNNLYNNDTPKQLHNNDDYDHYPRPSAWQTTKRVFFHLLLVIGMYLLFIVFLKVFGTHLLQRFDVHFEAYYGFIVGIIIYVFVTFIPSDYLKRNADWLRIFTHEVTHAIFIIAMFGKMESLNVHRPSSSGYVSAQGAPNNIFISLAPYFFPLYTLVILLFRLLVSPQWLFVTDILIGYTYTFHFTTFWRDARPYQSDLWRHGLLFSYTTIFCMNTFFIGSIITIIEGGYAVMFEQWLKCLDKIAHIPSVILEGKK